MQSALITIALAAWVVGMLTVLRMIVTGWHANQRWQRWRGRLSPTVFLASYNQKNGTVFMSCVGVGVVAVFLKNLVRFL